MVTEKDWYAVFAYGEKAWEMQKQLMRELNCRCKWRSPEFEHEPRVLFIIMDPDSESINMARQGCSFAERHGAASVLISSVPDLQGHLNAIQECDVHNYNQSDPVAFIKELVGRMSAASFSDDAPIALDSLVDSLKAGGEIRLSDDAYIIK